MLVRADHEQAKLPMTTMKATISVRPELPSDKAAVYRVLAAAFPTPAEADLVERLRAQNLEWVSLVAILDDQVVGHILFTPATVRNGDSRQEVVGLAPMAVLPEYQRRGIGSRLVIAGLKRCVDRGDSVVFVVGHPEFYPRFGFELAAPRGFHYIDEGFDPYLFVAELRQGALEDKQGWVEYHPEFDKLESEGGEP